MLNKKVCRHCSDEYLFFGWQKSGNANLWKDGKIVCPAQIKSIGTTDELEKVVISVSDNPPAQCPFFLEQRMAED